jgi:hypothetical protein
VSNRIPFPEPAHYDPARFEAVRRYFKAAKNPPLPWDLYPLPNNKYDANNGIGKQFSMGLVGACNGWSEADARGRTEIWEAHRQYTLEMYRFLTTDPDVPEAIRQELSAYGLCRDEFASSGHWSPQLYVREGRRLKGQFVLSQDDVMTHPEKPDAIAVSSFPIDSHDCQRIARADGTVIDEGTIMPQRMPGRRHGYPYHVPYRSLLPKKSECENLLVPVALSATHVAYCSIRVEPTWMILGQSAGIAAAMAADRGAAAADLAYPELRARLLAQKQVLDLPVLPDLPPEPESASVDLKKLPGTVVDDADADTQGPWVHSATFKNHIGRGYLHDDQRGDGSCTITFRARVPAPGRYDLRVAYSPHPTRAAKVPVRVECGTGAFELILDETAPLPQGDAFRSIGVVDLGEGAVSVTLSNSGTTGFVIADAVQFLPVKQ